MKQLTDTIYQVSIPTPFAVGDVHTYLIKGETLTLIDAGVKTDDAWEAMKYELKQLGYTPQDIEQIVLTHHHPDHIGLVDRFDRLKAIYGHQDNERWLMHDEAFFKRFKSFFYDLYKAFGVTEDYHAFFKHLQDPLKYVGKGSLTQALEEGDVLPGHPEWKVLETAGHAESHISFYREEDTSMISGDHLLHHISSNPLLEPPRHPGGERPRPLVTYRETMRKCLDLPIGTVYPGHGKIFEQPHELIRARLAKQEERAEKVYNMLHEPQTPFAVCKQLFPRHIEKQFGLTMSEAMGQLDYLESVGRVHIEVHDDVYYYQAK